MCVVSVIIKESQAQWGGIQGWPLQQVSEMQQIIQKLAEIDRKLGAKDCIDPVKEKFLADLDKRVEALEKTAKPARRRNQAVATQ